MRKITLKAHAKINPSLDVLARRPDGYHEVRLIMQLIELHDFLMAEWEERSPGGLKIRLTCDDPAIPLDEANLAWKAAAALADRLKEDGREISGELSIHIEKHIPMAAGLAGGSADGAAALLACSALWDTGFALETLLGIGARLGADVPFAMMGAARTNPELGMADDPMAAACALGEGTGTDLTVLPPADAHVLLAKPPIGVSTGEVYNGVDRLLGFAKDTGDSAAEQMGDLIPAGDKTAGPDLLGGLVDLPDIDLVVNALNKHDLFSARGKMGNTLELYTLKQYHEVAYTKCKIQECVQNGAACMSGSGPTVFLLAPGFEEVQAAEKALAGMDVQLILTRTVV